MLVSQLQLIQTYLLVDATLTDMLVEFNCDRCVRWSIATATNMPVCSKQRLKYRHCNMPASLLKLLQKQLLDSGMYAGPVAHNQTCVMVNMSADPVAMMPVQLVGRK